jgi:cholesterol transport system auxiliary component
MTQNILRAPSRRGVLAGGAALVLTGCSDLIGPTSAPQQFYLLRPTGGGPTAGPKVSWQLSVITPGATDRLDSARISLVQPDSSTDYYANSSWTDHLPNLVQDALVVAFENSGRIDAVAADSEGFHADYILQTELRDFAARYDQPDGIPTAVVRIQAKIAPALGREIIANLNVVHEVQATANSVPAAVQALDAAFGAVLSDIVNWALAVPLPKSR